MTGVLYVLNKLGEALAEAERQIAVKDQQLAAKDEQIASLQTALDQARGAQA